MKYLFLIIIVFLKNMYERINKLNNKINIYISNINNRFPYFKYKNNYNTSKAHDFLFNKKIQVPIYKPSNKLFFNLQNNLNFHLILNSSKILCYKTIKYY